MCGIFGIAYYGETAPPASQAKAMRKACRSLMSASEIRGADAAGVCVLANDHATIYKNNIRGREIVKRPTFNKALINIKSNPIARAVLGHTRAQTKGTHHNNFNNHPIITENVIGIHNGVIQNDEKLYGPMNIPRKGLVDSEVIFQLIDMYVTRRDASLIKAVKLTTEKLFGSYACAFIHLQHPNYLTLFRNSGYGNIYVYTYDTFDTMLFASLDTILDRAIEKNAWFNKSYLSDRVKLKDDSGMRINLENGKTFCFEIEDEYSNSYKYYCCG